MFFESSYKICESKLLPAHVTSSIGTPRYESHEVVKHEIHGRRKNPEDLRLRQYVFPSGTTEGGFVKYIQHTVTKLMTIC